MTMTTTLDDGITDVPHWLMPVGGSEIESASSRWHDVIAPSQPGKVLARVPAGTVEDVDVAVRAARDAQREWAAAHFTVRQKALLAIASDIEAESERLAVLTAQDTGNAIRTQARPEVATLISLFRYFGGVAGEFKGAVLPAGDDQLQYTRIEPLGVVGAILPWNSPLMIAGMKIPAALAAGNGLVVKPADEAPLTVLKLAEIARRHLPSGLLNVVTGSGREVGQAIVDHPGIHKVSFTGSTSVGRDVAASAGRRFAHVSLELGGKNPNIVFRSAATPARIEATVAGVLLAMRFTRQGQSCTAGSRLFVHRSVLEPVLERLVDAARQLVVGDPLDEKTDMGSIINQRQYDTIREYIEDGRQQPGVRVMLDGLDHAVDGEPGLYQGPTVFAGVDNSWRIAREEIFGPVLVVIPFDDADEVIRMANDSHYGLAAYIWSADLDEAVSTAHRLEAGWVQVNQGGGQVVGQSYGGYKESGIGREFSIEGAIAAFSQTKQVNIRLST